MDQLDNHVDEKPKEIGLKFWKNTYDLVWRDACTGCGKSFAESVSIPTPVYVIGVYYDYQGRKGYQLSATKPDNIDRDRHNGTGYSYWSYLLEELGKEYYLTKKEAEK